ncbi:MAG: hypothetical protein J6T97_01030 [Bacteroidaceae bacterium]|nr:hypothetical protein [Bacteroidaceae bacterium]MBR5159025.1 hypothetical protein [Bacteroidaceae bacterium]
MKRLEDIEKLSMLDLDRIASDESIKVPSSLKHDIAVTARALEMSSKEEDEVKETHTHHHRYRKILKMISYPAAAVAVVTIGLHLSFQDSIPTPKDTFDDPKMAYVQMEQVFGFISEKMNTGIDIADAAEPVIDKTINALR